MSHFDAGEIITDDACTIENRMRASPDVTLEATPMSKKVRALITSSYVFNASNGIDTEARILVVRMTASLADSEMARHRDITPPKCD